MAGTINVGGKDYTIGSPELVTALYAQSGIKQPATPTLTTVNAPIGSTQATNALLQNASQVTGIPAQTFTTPTMVADSLNTNNSAIKLPPKPVDTNNYSTKSGNAMIDAYNTSNNSTDQFLKDFLTESKANAPVDQTANYLKEYDSIVGPKDQAIIDKQTAVTASRKKLDVINAQLRSITDEQTAKELQFKNEGISQGAIQGRNLDLERSNAIRVLPLQAEALIAQAEISANQGDLQTAQLAQAQAQDKLNSVFKFHSDYAKQMFDYNQHLIDTVYDYATKKEQQQLDAQKNQDAIDLKIVTDQMNYARDLAKTALENGQADIASALTQLDPNDPSYMINVGNVASQIVQKQKPVEVSAGASLIDPITGKVISTAPKSNTPDNSNPKKSVTSFTTTQLNKGASNAGVSIEEFKNYSDDDKNFFINSIIEKKKTIDDAQKSGEDLNSLINEINSSNLSAIAKANLIDYARSLYPQTSQSSSGFSWWNPLTWGQGIYDATHK